MEVLIPIVALGGLALSMKDTPQQENPPSSHPKNKAARNLQKAKEGYANITPFSPSDYPAPKTKNRAAEGTNYSSYNNPNDATEKYFDQHNYYQNEIRGKKVGNNMNQVHSLTGSYVDENNFSHNNMIPFNGSKTTQHTLDGTRSDTMLDNMSGGGSQYIKKQERAPLFQPQDNVQLSHGQPNMNDFFQSRTNPGLKFNNMKPFEKRDGCSWT